MRNALRKRVRQLVERVTDDLTELAVRRVEAELERMTEAFSVALSAYRSNGAPDLLTAALGPELAGMLSTTTASAVEDNPRPTKRSKGRPRPATAQATAAGNVAEPHRVPSGHRDADDAGVDTSSQDPPRRICGCAARGPHRRGCSLPSVSASPSIARSHDDDDDESTYTPPITKQDRFARIEAAASARRAGAGAR